MNVPLRPLGTGLLLGGLLSGGLLSGGLLAGPAQAAGALVVTTPADSGAGSLRQALADAAASSADDTIVFDPSVTGTIVLTGGELVAQVGGDAGNLVIDGPGAGTLGLDAQGDSRVLRVTGSTGTPAPSFEMSGLTVSHGRPATYGESGGGLLATDAAVRLTDVVMTSNQDAGDGWSPASGGGVAVASNGGAASLVIDASTITDNTASDLGGGVFAADGVPVTISDTSVRDNRAWSVARGSEVGIMHGRGGGIAAGQLNLTDSTVSGNTAQLQGGGVLAHTVEVDGSTIAENQARYEGGGVLVDGTETGAGASMRSSTVTGNRADAGAGLHAAEAPVTLTLSTIASNSGVDGGGVFANGAVTLEGAALSTNAGGDLRGTGTASLLRSLVQDPAGFTTVDDGGAVLGHDAILRPLSDDGGATATRLPAGNSPLIDQGSAFGAALDQRGSTRPVDDPGVADAEDGSDIGSVEATASELAGPAQVADLSRPTTAGEARIGSTLTADGGTWSPESATLTYQWLRDGRPIAGATQSTYTLTIEDYDRNWYGEDKRKRISVQVTATAPGLLPSVVESTPTGYVRPGIVRMQGDPRLRGKPLVGRTLRAKPRLHAVTPSGCSVDIAWYVGHRYVRRAHDRRTLELRPWMRGKRVKVHLRYQDVGYSPLTKVVRTAHRVR